MDAHFWLQRWEANEIAFHRSEVNPLLVSHFEELGLAPGDRVFVPLCGRTVDISWLLSRRVRVAGAELSETAIGQLFADLGTEPIVTEIDEGGALKHYCSMGIDIFVGDIFKLDRALLSPVDAVFDRAALVALPELMRADYARHLTAITGAAPQLLITYEYDQTLADGPPFSIAAEEVTRYYRDGFTVRSLAIVEVEGGLKGRFPAREHVWLLTRPQMPAEPA